MLVSHPLLLATRITNLSRFTIVGKKFFETVIYDADNCQRFESMLTENPSLQGSDTSQNVNRLFLGCLFSGIIGSNLPLSIYLSQSIDFKKDVQKGEEVVGEVQVVKDLGRKRYQLRTTCWNRSGQIVMEGQAIILQE